MFWASEETLICNIIFSKVQPSAFAEADKYQIFSYGDKRMAVTTIPRKLTCTDSYHAAAITISTFPALCNLILTKSHEANLVLISISTDEDSGAESRQAHADSYTIRKPWNLDSTTGLTPESMLRALYLLHPRQRVLYVLSHLKLEMRKSSSLKSTRKKIFPVIKNNFK